MCGHHYNPYCPIGLHPLLGLYNKQFESGTTILRGDNSLTHSCIFISTRKCGTAMTVYLPYIILSHIGIGGGGGGAIKVFCHDNNAVWVGLACGPCTVCTEMNFCENFISVFISTYMYLIHFAVAEAPEFHYYNMRVSDTHIFYSKK